MKQLADFNYYKENYKGTFFTDESAFNSCCMKSSIYLGSITLNRVFNEEYCDKDEVKMCACEVAEVYMQESLVAQSLLAHDGHELSSEKVGEYSVTYASSDTEKQTKAYALARKQVATKYLSTLGLLYSGSYVYE